MSYRASAAEAEHWQTPASHLDYLNLTDIHDNGASLTLIVKSGTYEQSGRFQFVWNRYCAYRSTDEAHFPGVAISDSSQRGDTYRVINSGWIAELAEGNDLLAFHYPNLQHFVIISMDYVTEVLSSHEPEILQLEEETVL